MNKWEAYRSYLCELHDWYSQKAGTEMDEHDRIIYERLFSNLLYKMSELDELEMDEAIFDEFRINS